VCHQTVCLVARHLESAGIPTLCLASALDIVRAGQPPRTAFVDYPLGHTAGRPFDRADQRRVVSRALEIFTAASEPGAISPIETPLVGGWPAAGWREAAVAPRSGDTRQPRDVTPRYQCEEDRRLVEGA